LTANQKNKVKEIFTWLVIIAVVVGGSRLLQTYLGQRALDNTGLEPLSLQQAIHKAKQEGKLVLADMSALYCSTCRKLDNEIFANELVQQQLDEHFVYARIEYSSEQGDEFMRTYQVQGFPTVLIIDAEGTKLGRMPLIFDPNEYSQLLKTANSRFNS
jgi:thioredoxin-related protein